MPKRSEDWKRRRDAVLPGRKDYAKRRFAEEGIHVVSETSTSLVIRVHCNNVTYHPFSGSYTGRGVASGRGIENLIAVCRK